jgi:hypothetical protein
MKRDAGKEKLWRETMAEAQGSGQNVREFCRQRRIKESQFYAWRRELKTRDAEAAEKGGVVELVRPAGGKQGAGISIRIDDRFSIVLERGFDGVALKSALTAVLGAAGR